ncbi:MAG: protein kinase [Holophagaceae bacterium]|nr:protein kinase [Holophagaceae bacterium]
MNTDLHTFGSYRLIQQLGEGAMGTVWRAMDLRLEREVALKILRNADEVRHRALLHEAKMACQLNHPNIAHIYEAGEVDGTPFIAMELVVGSTLGHFAGKPAEGSWLRSIAAQAASALHYAHQKGLVHRDIKPDNLVLNNEGVLKILDFGIAQHQSSTPLNGPTGHHATLVERTAPGYSQGTPAYMSPEQANGWAVEPSSDQFSLGVVLHELATGAHPFMRATLVETLFAVVKEQLPPLRASRPDLPANLGLVIDRMLEKVPEERFPSLQAAVEALQEGRATQMTPFLHGSPTEKVRTGEVRESDQTGRRWLMASAVVPLLVAGGAYAWWRGRTPETGLGMARLASTKDFAKGRRMVAILPVEMLTGDESQAWLSSSFADAMASGLVAREDILVVDRLRVTEAMNQLGEVPGKPLRSFGQLAKALNAEWVVQGTYQMVEGRVRMGIRILDSATGTVLKQFSVERSEARLLEIEDELQRRLPKEMGLSNDDGGIRYRAKNPRTRELFIKGNALFTQGGMDSLMLAKSMLQEALDLEPDYAPAHAAMAWTLSELGSTKSLSQGKFDEGQDIFSAAKAHAEKAIQLDPHNEMAFRALSAIRLRRGDVEGASKAALEAIRLDPGDTRAYHVLADTFAGLDGEENHLVARRYFEKALALDPDNPQAHYRYAVLLQNDGDLENALRHADRSIVLNPSKEFAYVTAADSLLWMGRNGEAEARIARGLKEAPGSLVLKSLDAYCAYERGDAATVARDAAELVSAWPADHSNQVLLQGLVKAVAKDAHGTHAVYAAFFRRCQAVDWTTRRHNEKRVASVNLYFMARTLAKLGLKSEAKPLVDLADQLHTGKRKVAKRDPAFR